jgi:hypothetical protein
MLAGGAVVKNDDFQSVLWHCQLIEADTAVGQVGDSIRPDPPLMQPVSYP